MSEATKSRTKLAIAALAVASLSLSCCVGFGAGGLAGIAYWKGKTDAGDKGAGGGKMSVVKSKLDAWGFQDFQDHLAAKGMKTSRGAGRYSGRQGMWFEDGDGKPIEWGFLDSLNSEPIYASMMLSRGTVFFVEPFADATAADREVKLIKDVQQKTVLSCGKYVIHGSPAMLDRLKKILP